MKRVAERAGVSIATVSRVVSKSGFVAPSLQKVVMEAMEALRYQPSAVARGLRTRETRSIGVLVPQLSQPFFSSLAYAIERTLLVTATGPFCAALRKMLRKNPRTLICC
jgi:DNA-binding LacI/PurR family transcriptional regulator